MSPLENISLYIPHVFPNFDREFLTKQFNQMGDVDHIDMVLKQDRDGKPYNAVYIHFNSWHENQYSIERFHARVLDPELEARFYYDGPWYWIVLPNTAKKHVSGDRKPKIDLGGAKSICAGSFITPEKPILKRQTNDIIPPTLIRQNNAVSRATMPMTPRNLEVDFSDPVYTYTKEDFDNMEEIDNCLMHEDVCDYCLDFIECEEMYTADIDEIFDQMDEVEDIMESEQDIYFANYDSRYVNAIEQENAALRAELYMYKVVC